MGQGHGNTNQVVESKSDSSAVRRIIDKLRLHSHPSHHHAHQNSSRGASNGADRHQQLRDDCDQDSTQSGNVSMSDLPQDTRAAPGPAAGLVKPAQAVTAEEVERLRQELRAAAADLAAARDRIVQLESAPASAQTPSAPQGGQLLGSLLDL